MGIDVEDSGSNNMMHGDDQPIAACSLQEGVRRQNVMVHPNDDP
jgi:hypothetical protein